MSHILVVCTANVCRSPTTAALLRAALGSQIQVRSAGTEAAQAPGVCPVAAEWLGLRLGGRFGERLPARQVEAARRAMAEHHPITLSAEMIIAADLILTMTREHRSAVVGLVPSAQRRTFPIRYAARLAPDLVKDPSRPADKTDRVQWLAQELHARRADYPAGADRDAVPDPHVEGRHPAALAALGQASGLVLDVLARR